MLDLMNIIIVSPYKTSTLLGLYSFNNLPKFFFIIQTSSTLFHVNLVLNILRFVIQQFSYMKVSYLLLEIKLVLIHWMMNIFTITYVIDTIPY